MPIVKADSPALRAAQLGDLDSALFLCHARLEADSSDPEGLLLAAKLTRDGHRSEALFAKLAEGGATGPRLAEALYRMGQYQFARGRYRESGELFGRAAAAQPGGSWHHHALCWQGLAFTNQGESNRPYLDRAKDTFLEIIRWAPPRSYPYAMALEGLARARLASGDLEGARESLEMSRESAKSDQQPALDWLSMRVAGREGNHGVSAFIRRRLHRRHPYSLEGRAANDGLGRGNGSGEIPPAISLQMGAFSQRANALARVKQLSDLRIEAVIEVENRPGKTLFKVRTGHFPSLVEAKEYAESVLKPRGIPYYLSALN